MLNTEPLIALRRLAAAAARALRISERQTHLECEIRTQKVRKVGAVGTISEPYLVSATTQMIEQKITRPIAQHFMQRRPRRCSVERRVEKLLDPCRIQIFRRAIPRVAQGPDALRGRTRRRRSVVAHDDFPDDRAAFGRCAVAYEFCVPRPRG